MNVRRHRAVELALTLYISRLDSDHEIMVQTLRDMIESRLGRHRTYVLDVIDVSSTPEIHQEHSIYATPTLVRTTPAPELRIVGDLNKSHKILTELILVDEEPRI